MPESKSIEEMIKKGYLKKGSDPSLVLDRLPFGIPALDELLGGGLPIGRATGLYGPESTGKTLLAQYATAAIQKQPKRNLGLYMDLEKSFDYAWWKQSGVDIDNLYVSSPPTAEEAIDIMVSMVEGSDELGLIILDSIPGMIPAVQQNPKNSAEERTVGDRARLVTLMYSKLIHSMSIKKVTLITLNQMRDNIGGHDDMGALPGGKAQRHFSHVILRTRREGWIKEGNNNTGFYMEIISKKNKTCNIADGSSITLPFTALGGIDLLTADLEDAIKKGVIGRGGPYYKFAGENFLGMPNLRQFFIEHPNEVENLRTSINLA